MPSDSQTPPFWLPTVHLDRRPLLLARGAVKARLGEYLTGEGFLEVDTPALQVSPGNEAHLHAFATEAITPDGSRAPLYLATSPEFAMKKLLVAGEQRIFSFAHAFRNRERGALHHPEFTMLEWYRAEEPYEALMRDCAEMLVRAVEATGVRELRFRGLAADPYREPERLSVADAFTRHAGIDLLATVADDGTTDPDALRRALVEAEIRTAPDDTWSDMFSRVLVERIEPKLGIGRPTILDRYPIAEAALARPAPDDPRVAQRFELFVAGVELANGFGELTDPREQRRRFLAEMAEKQRVYGESYPIDEDFLAALGLMPPASGVALGFDRLMMLATHAPRIENVMWAPVVPVGG